MRGNHRQTEHEIRLHTKAEKNGEPDFSAFFRFPAPCAVPMSRPLPQRCLSGAAHDFVSVTYPVDFL
jgi:hypothetical protein